MTDKEGKKLYSIGQIAKVTDTSTKTLRYYDQLGLVRPESVDEHTHYRYYTQEQIFRVFLVKRLQSFGFSLQEIQELLAKGDAEAYRGAVTEKLANVQEQIRALEVTFREGLFFVDKIEMLKAATQCDNFDKVMDKNPLLAGGITLEMVEERQVIFTKRTMEHYNNLEISVDRWTELYNRARHDGLAVRGAMILCYPTAAPMEQFFDPNCQVEIMLPIEKAPAERDDVRIFGGFQAASIYHVGTYANISDSHVELLRWIKEKGLQITGPIAEEYLLNPFDLDVQPVYITKIIAPIRG